MDMVSQIAVEQRLPYGGEVTARVLNTLMRDLTNHVTTAKRGHDHRGEHPATSRGRPGGP